MQLTSRYPFTVFWRTFDSADTAYLIGQMEGVLLPEQFVEINHPSGQFQMELKREGIGGAWVVRPGEVFSNTDNRVLNLRVVNGVPLGILVKV